MFHLKYSFQNCLAFQKLKEHEFQRCQQGPFCRRISSLQPVILNFQATMLEALTELEQSTTSKDIMCSMHTENLKNSEE